MGGYARTPRRTALSGSIWAICVAERRRSRPRTGPSRGWRSSCARHFGKQVDYDGAKDGDTVLKIVGEGPATATPAEQK